MPGRAHPLDLGELIDLELQFAADRDADRPTLRERDDRIGRRIVGDAPEPTRHELFRRWLAELRSNEAATTGERVESLYRWIGLALAAVGFFAGAGTARAVLAYDGTHPVNIVHFLAVFAVAQIALLALWLAALMPAARSMGRRAYAPVHEIIRQLVYRRSGAGRARDIGPLLGRLGALGTVYGAAERWRLMALTQRAAFFFNVGALVTCLYLIAFTDLAFAWSTTLEVDPGTMTVWLRALAWPWRWLDAAVPDATLVEASRYFRLAGRRYDPHALKDWWAFLIAALVAYGLLPRLALWQITAWRSRAIRRALALDHGDSQVAYERLTRCLHGWCGLQDGAPVNPAYPSLPPRPAPFPHGANQECTVVRWADVPLAQAEAARLLQERFGWRLGTLYSCGGRAGDDDTSRVLADVECEPRERPLVVLAEAWEAPSRAITRFLGELRRASAARRNLVVGLLGAHDGVWSAPAADDYEVWRRGAAALGDPYLRVEPMVGDGA